MLAMLGPFVIRRFVSLKNLSANNEVAGFKFATVGVTYAVLLAFAVFVVWEKFSDAESDVAREAGAAVNIYRLAQGIDGEPGAALRTRLLAYLETAISEDWPAMERAKGSPAATRALDSLYAVALTYRPADQRGAAVFAYGAVPQTSVNYDDKTHPLAESITPDGKYRFRYYEGDVVGIQKPSSSSADGWATEYVYRDGVCPCTGHQYRGDCKHKPIAQALIRWWHDVGVRAATTPTA